MYVCMYVHISRVGFVHNPGEPLESAGAEGAAAAPGQSHTRHF